ncbi:hypothetical protein ASPVEDRAFT_77802 [Aspergillus versicolor CBS 583.65]|uniref:DUF1308 domain-containing protein n=1 Tax=Aspergillus versicolor CBS 583.65 TaxID=1036611 RepID=A0A1L9P3F1_ASPVE|nr:uncharacterized protein ASPVEDRAFT_77802 [Aspergillus versicolor CBS 583.65]OJI96028.1 hypothetical protein ASPVEDRAFT_77802 [Aspergillus versicolor CBS 583.65]
MRGSPLSTEEPQVTVVSSYNPNPSNQDAESSSSGKNLAQSLVTRCRTLLAELDAFKALLAETQRNPQTVEVRSLRSNALSELRTLEKLSTQLEDASARLASQDDESEEAIDIRAAELRAVHALRSSNLPFYEAVWTITKRTCTGLVAFGKRFYWEEGAGKKNLDKRKSVLVDIVADDGEEWVKVSTISETRLLFEMAKKGWEGGSDIDEDGEERTVLQNHGREYDSDYDDDDDDDDEIELLKLASDMGKAANLVRVNYRRPRLRFMIPKIVEGQVPEIDDLIRAIRSHGVVVVCGEDVSTVQTFDKSEHPLAEAVSVQDEVRSLLPNRFKRFTPTLNVDCTLLLAIISDLSHSMEIAPSQQHHRAINRQIEIERERPLLPTELWPAMESHELVCTGEAAQRMREIVETIGTETEKQRMTIIMGDQPFAGAKSASIVEELQKMSDYQVPAQLGLPIRVVDASKALASGNKQAKLPPIAQKVEEILSDINTSVFMYGWVSDIMTITSNRTVVKQIENLIEMHRDEEDLIGPLIWVCDTARSLIGKEKGRRD